MTLFVFLALLAHSVVAQATESSSFTLAGDAFAITSTEFETDVVLNEDASVKVVAIRVEQFGDAPTNVVSMRGGSRLCIGVESCAIATPAPGGVSSASTLVARPLLLAAATTVAASSSLPRGALLGGALLAAFGTGAAAAPGVSGVRFVVTITTPAAFVFTSLQVRVTRGEFLAQTRLSALDLQLRFCAQTLGVDDATVLPLDGASNRVQLSGGLSLANAAVVCASGAINLGATRSLNAAATYKLSAGSTAAVTFASRFAGAVSLTPGATASVDFKNSDCRASSTSGARSQNGFVGQCGDFGGTHKLDVVAGGGISIAFTNTANPAATPAPAGSGEPIVYPPSAPDTLVRRGATWRFTTGSEAVSPLAGDAWAQSEFDDSAWMSGDAPFGYGDDDRGAIYNYKLVAPVRHFYARTRFSVSAAQLAFSDNRRLLVASDDGADVYLNGVQINAGSSENHEARYWNDQITLGSELRAGDNVLAVYVSNSGQSTDIYFDLEVSILFNKIDATTGVAQPTTTVAPPTTAPPSGATTTTAAPTTTTTTTATAATTTTTTTTRAGTTTTTTTRPPTTTQTPLPTAAACGAAAVAPNCSPTYRDPEPNDCAPASPAITGTVNPPLLAAYNERVTLRRPAASLDDNPRGAACPYNEANLKLWTDPSTWAGGAVPTAATNEIILPADTKVLVTSCTFAKSDVYKKIRIPRGSELIFSDAPIELHVRGIIVEGRLRIGAPNCRYVSDIKIIFHGQKTTDPSYLDSSGDKGIFVPGTIDVHGKQYHPTWTRLSQTAAAGDDRVHLQDNVNWEVGQQVVVITSIYEDNLVNQNEVMTIRAVTGRTVQFTAPLRFAHYGGAEYQVEVALLSRRIEFKGDDADSRANFFGGHVLITGVGRISGVRLTQMGQTNVLARYPLHFHLAKDCPDCFFKDNACHGTFYRCVTIHGTNYATISRNVAFDVRGFAFYMEDGVEHDNIVSHNLAAYIRTIGPIGPEGGQGGFSQAQTCAARGCESSNLAVDVLQPADTTASGFYISNAWNRYFGNAASGGYSGFAFPNLFKSIGPSAGAAFSPAEATTLEFDGNTAHSAGYYWSSGSCVYTGGDLFEQTDASKSLFYHTGRKSRSTRANYTLGRGKGEEAPMKFTNLKVFLCNQGVMHWGDRLDIERFEAIDTVRTVSLFGDASVVHALFNGRSANPVVGFDTMLPGSTWQRASKPIDGYQFQFYDTGTKTIFSDVIMRNAKKPWLSMTHSDQFKPLGMNGLANIRYENSDTTMNLVTHSKDADTGAARYFNWIDHDGSMSAEAPSDGERIICGSNTNDWWRFHNNCKLKWTDRMVCCKTQGLRDDVARIEFKIPGIVPGPSYQNGSPSKRIGETCLFGDDVAATRCTPFTDQEGVCGVSGRGWYFVMNNGSPKSMTFHVIQLSSLSSVTVAISYPAGSTFTLNSDTTKRDAAMLGSLSSLRSSNTTAMFFDGSTLFIKIVNNEARDAWQRGSCWIHDPRNDFKRGVDGAFLRHYTYCTQWRFTANCPTTTTSNGASFCAGPKAIPNARLI